MIGKQFKLILFRGQRKLSVYSLRKYHHENTDDCRMLIREEGGTAIVNFQGKIPTLFPIKSPNSNQVIISCNELRGTER